MTNEEIEQKARALIKTFVFETQTGGGTTSRFQNAVEMGRNISEFARSLVSQAYEEALRIGEALERRVDACDESLPSGESLGQVSVIVAEHVGQFRALKDSIALEPVSSLP
jgi:hypothetical protein